LEVFERLFLFHRRKNGGGGGRRAAPRATRTTNHHRKDAEKRDAFFEAHRVSIVSI